MFEHAIAILEKCQRELEEFRMGGWLRTEQRMLKRWKSQPHSFHTLPTGEVVVYGPGRVQSLRTAFIRSQYTANDVDYLTRVVMASRVIVADEANRILRTMKPDTSRPKRRPTEADPDPYLPHWRERPEQYLSARELVMKSGLKGRALTRELARIR